MKFPFLGIPMLFVVLQSYGQTAIQNHYNNEGVVITSQAGSCEFSLSEPALQFKFITVSNTSNERVKVNFQLEVHYNDHCAGCNGSPEYHTELILEPHSSISGSRNSSSQGRLEALVSNPNLPGLVFNHLSITEVQIQRIH